MTSKQTEETRIYSTTTRSAVQNSHDASDEVPGSPTHSVHTSKSRSSHSSVQTSSTAEYERQEREAEDAFNQLIEQLCQDLWPTPTSLKHRFLASQAITRLRTKKFIRSCTCATDTADPALERWWFQSYHEHNTTAILPSKSLQSNPSCTS